MAVNHKSRKLKIPYWRGYFFLALTGSMLATALAEEVFDPQLNDEPRAHPPIDFTRADALAHFAAAQIAWIDQETDVAVSEALKAQKLQPKSPELNQFAAKLLQQANRHREAQNVLEQFVAGAPGNMEARLWLGKAYEQCNDPERALQVYQEAQGDFPDRFILYKAESALHQRAGRTDAARVSLEAAMAHAKNRSRAIRALSRFLVQEGEPDDAIRHLQQALEQDAEQWDLQRELAHLMLQQGHIEEGLMRWLKFQPENARHRQQQAADLSEQLGGASNALTEVTDFQNRNPELTETTAIRGELLLLEGQTNAAIQAIRTAIGLNQEDPWLAIRLAELLLPSDANAALQQAERIERRLRQVPEAETTTISNGIAFACAKIRSLALATLNREAEALAAFASAQRLLLKSEARRDVEFHLHYALTAANRSVQLATDQLQLAIQPDAADLNAERLLAAPAIDPAQQLKTLRKFRQRLTASGRPDTREAGLAVLEEGARREPRNPLWAAEAGRFCLANQQPAHAVKHFRQAEDAGRFAPFGLHILDDEFFTRFGEACFQVGENRLAEQQWMRAVNRNPHCAEAFHGMARMFLQAGKWLDEAESMAARAVSIDAENAAYHVTLGQILQKVGKEKEAEKALQKAKTLNAELEDF